MFQFISWKEGEQFDELESEGTIFTLIGALIFVINCSSNYFIYRYILWKETKEKKVNSHVEMPTRLTHVSSQAAQASEV